MTPTIAKRINLGLLLFLAVCTLLFMLGISRGATTTVARVVMATPNGVITTPLSAIPLGTNTLTAPAGVLLFNGAALSGGGGAAMPTQTLSVVTAGGTTGIVFTGTFAPLPQAPATPMPSDAATGITQPVTLSWTDVGTGYGVATRFDVLTNGTLAASAQTATSLLLPSMGDGAAVSWQVIAHNNSGATTGAVWGFTTYIITGGGAEPGPSFDSLSGIITIGTDYPVTWTNTDMSPGSSYIQTSASPPFPDSVIEWSSTDHVWYLGWSSQHYYTNSAPTGTWTSINPSVTYPFTTTTP